MNTRTLLLCAAIATTTATAQAQYKAGSMVQYKVIWDNPDKIKPAVISLDVLAADMWQTSYMMGYGLRADVNAPRYGSLLLDYRNGYLGKKHRALELGGALNLFSSRRKKLMQVSLSSSSYLFGGKLFSSSTSISVPGTRKTMLQARAGLASFNVHTDPGSSVEGFYMQKDTIIVPITDFGKNFRGVYSFTATLKAQMYYVGLGIRTINNLVVSHERGVASNSNNYNFYVDVLTGGDPRFSDIVYKYSNLAFNGFPAGTQLTDYELGSTEVKKIGWRAGWEAKTNNGVGFSYKAEFGSRPGYKGEVASFITKNTYVLLSAGFSIGAGKSYRKLITEEKKNN